MMIVWKIRYCLIPVLLGCLLYPLTLSAACWLDDSSPPSAVATHVLVNGKNKKPAPEILFKVPGAGVGDSSLVLPDTITNAGNPATLNKHVRFRLGVRDESTTGVRMYFDSSAPLNCVGCSSNVSIPFTKFSWTVGSGDANNTGGPQPSAGAFTGGEQSMIYVAESNHTLGAFNLQFNFMNDEVYPAGTYKGTFFSRGKPE